MIVKPYGLVLWNGTPETSRYLGIEEEIRREPASLNSQPTRRGDWFSHKPEYRQSAQAQMKELAS